MVIPSFGIIVAYPRAEGEDPNNPGSMREDLVYHNDATLFFMAADENEVEQGESDQLDDYQYELSASTTWEDYKFVYNGEIVSRYKTFDSSNTSPAGATHIHLGYDVMAGDVKVGTTINGYHFENGFSFETEDEALFARAYYGEEPGPYVRLDASDYEIAPINYFGGPKVCVTLRSSDIDKQSGQTIVPPIPEESFILWGKKADEEWVEIERIPMVSGKENYYIEEEKFTDQEYTGLRLTSPEGLEGQYVGMMYFRIKLKGSSEKLKNMLDEGADQIYIGNISGHKLYAPDENGEYQWVNSHTSSTCQLAKVTGLDAQDYAEYGAYVYRDSAGVTLKPAKYAFSFSKAKFAA